MQEADLADLYFSSRGGLTPAEQGGNGISSLCEISLSLNFLSNFTY
jgi:hypothetical protein